MKSNYKLTFFLRCQKKYDQIHSLTLFIPTSDDQKIMEKKYIAAIDQGTTSTRFVIFDKNSKVISSSQMEHAQIFPRPGWVEHDPEEIISNIYKVMKDALEKASIDPKSLSSIGVTNQRETVVIWDKTTGKPLYNAIVWQDTRTGDLCRSLEKEFGINSFREKTGLPIATYFSGPKIKWLIDNIEKIRESVIKGNALAGTIDSWIIWNLTGGCSGGVHITDVTNASRTLLMNLHSLSWDDEMLKKIGVPSSILPEIRSSSEIYGYIADGLTCEGLPISGALGDQQAALFGQTCFAPGEAKNTYGTGCFLLLNTGGRIVQSKHGMLTTLAYKIGDSDPVYALEGSIAIAGSLVQWLRDNFGLIRTAQDIENLAATVDDSGGIYIVPAFSGLFAPRWRSDARGIIVGLTHYINKGHMARSVLEASAFQTREIFDAMKEDSGIELKNLRVDGGMTANSILMQFQADILEKEVVAPEMPETTVLGAAYAAGLSSGFWDNIESLRSNWKPGQKWTPNMENSKVKKLYSGWLKAVEKSYDWAEN